MKLLKRIVKGLASPYLTIVLLVLILLAVSLGTLVYSKLGRQGDLQLATQLVFHSIWFLLFNLLLLLNTLLCTVRQLKLAFKRYKRFVALTPLVLEEQERKIITKYGYSRRGHKYPFGVFMSPLFHLGLALIILGAFTDHFAGFTGYLSLQPGIIREDSPLEYLELEEKPFYWEGYQRFSIEVEQVYLDYHATGAVSSGMVSIHRDGGQVIRQLLDSYNPIWLGTVAISKDKYGYYTGLRIEDKAGNVVDERSVGLQTYVQDKATRYLRTQFSPGDIPYSLDLELFPTVGESHGQYLSTDYRMKEPAVFTSVYRGATPVFSGLVRQGQTVQLADGNKFTFTSVTPYLYVRVQSILGTYILGTGFVVFLLGLLVYFTLYPAILTIKRQEGQYEVMVTAWGGRFALQVEAKMIEDELNLLRKDDQE